MEEVAKFPRRDPMEVASRTRFEHVWREHRPRIWRLVARLAAEPDVADDLTQEVSLRAYRAFGSFRAESSVFTWLARIAINVVNRHREQSQRAILSLDTSDLAALEAPEARRFEEIVLGSDLRLAVWSALERLPEELRTTLILQVYEGLKYREIASILKVPLSTVKYRRHEAMLRLREELKEYAL